MNKKILTFIIVMAVVYVIYHIATLIYSPFPWFDEVSFASMTESFMKDHTFYETPRIIEVPEQKLQYGPIYFIIQSFVFKVLGFGIFNFRLTNLLFGFIDLFLIYKICRKLGFTLWAAIITMVLVAIEPSFNQFLHSGRMDFICLFFFMSSFLVYSEIKPGKLFIPYSLIVGLLLASAMLTTPRIIFAFSAFVLFFIYELFALPAAERKNVLLKFVLIGVGFGALYYLWIYKAYGGLNGYIFNNYQNSKTMQEHIGIGSKIRLGYYLFIILYAIGAFFLLVKNKLLAKNASMAILCLPPILGFVFIVTGGISGRYFALVTPFTSVFIVGVTVYLVNSKVLKYITYTICILFGGVFLFKGAYILSSLDKHEPYANEKMIMKYVEKNTSVCGDFAYYYMARNNGCSFLSLEENGGLEQKIEYMRDHKIRYVIISKNNVFRKGYQSGFLATNYKLIADIEDQNKSTFFSRILKKLPYSINDSYACYIYEYTGG